MTSDRKSGFPTRRGHVILAVLIAKNRPEATAHQCYYAATRLQAVAKAFADTWAKWAEGKTERQVQQRGVNIRHRAVVVNRLLKDNLGPGPSLEAGFTILPIPDAGMLVGPGFREPIN